ncbi:MAG: alpha-2-macroglobulin family protein [Patescibacteria group bacterium]
MAIDWTKKRLFFISGILFVIAASLITYGIGIMLQRGQKLPIKRQTPTGQATEIIPLVADKISQSAAIVLHLPKSLAINAAQAKEQISFEPKINGAWAQSQNPQELIFQPKKKLEIGKYYLVKIASQFGELKKDFLIDDDPKVIAVFPQTDSEASEFSEVNIIFNRPMAPLTTIDALKEEKIPVQIIPQTAGRFKWISTRNLQFKPENRLIRSSHYTVRIKPGFVSLDGLSVDQQEFNFTIRPLRYQTDIERSQTVLYDKPFRLYFNQPINLARTKQKITVSSLEEVKMSDPKAGEITQFVPHNIPFIAEYGKRTIYDEKSKSEKEITDTSILSVWNAKDRHSRAKFWDFDSQYRITIKGAVPEEGDILLTEEREIDISIPNLIANVFAMSDRLNFAEPEMFDPQGELIINFYEEIDKDASIMRGDDIQDITYGQKCKLDEYGNEVRIGEECEKEVDYNQIKLSFKTRTYQPAEEVNVKFNKIVNKAGLQLNVEPIEQTIVIYPKLTLYKTAPQQDDHNVSLTELIICSSTALQIPADPEKNPQKIDANLSLGRLRWQMPYKVSDPQAACGINQFETILDYGLLPESDYNLTLHLVDDFGQTASKTIRFTSGKVPDIARNFYHFQDPYNVTFPGKTKLTYAVDNLEYVNLHICQVDAKTLLDYLYNKPSYTTGQSQFLCLNSIEKRIELPKKFWTKNYFQIDLKNNVPNPLGHYILTFSHPDYKTPESQQWQEQTKSYIKKPGKQIYERTFLTVTNLAVQEKKINWPDWDAELNYTKKKLENPNLYWVSQIGTLAPVEGAKINFYIRDEKASNIAETGLESVLTDSQGIAHTPLIHNLLAVVVSKGQDSTILTDYSGQDTLKWGKDANSAERIYIYTDRPIYRPGDKVYVKGLHRLGYDGDYEIFRDKKEVILVNNNRGDLIFSQDLTINEYGASTAEFTLPITAALGNYNISVGNSWGYFEVEEYAPSPFKVDVKSDKEEYLADDALKLKIDANYYFGVPVSGVEVEYSFLAQDYYFDRYADEYFSFGQGWYYDYDASGYGDKFILRNKAILDEKGQANIELPLDFAKYFKEEEVKSSKIFIAYLTVKNQSGQAVSQQKSVIVHRGEFYLGVNLTPSFASKNEAVTVKIKSVDVKGKPVQISNITLKISKIKWDYFRRQEVDGGYYYKSEKKLTPVKTLTLNTDEQGNTKEKIKLDQEGEYEAEVSALDNQNNSISALEQLYIYGEGEVNIRPTNDASLELVSDKTAVEIGEKTQVIIKSPFPKAKALISLERGKIFDYQIIDINQNLFAYNFIVKEEYLPNVYFSALLLSSQPSVKFGQINFRVNTKQKEIDIKVSSDKTNYLPGEKVNLTVETRNFKGQPISAELSLAVVDMSVLALKGNPKKNPVSFFYNGLPLTVTTASNLKNVLQELDVPYKSKGGGGSEPNDLSKKKRGIFKDTAYWNGIVRTDANGKTQVSFDLPDNLTTWQAEAVGITFDTKLGIGYNEFKTEKKLMIVPLKPRFILPGDEFSIGANIFNETDDWQKLNVSLESQTLQLNNRSNQESIIIKPHAKETIYFAAQAPETIEQGAHSFAISAKNKKYEDAVEQSIPIKSLDTYEASATAAFSNKEKEIEYLYLPDNVIKNKGGLTIKTNATLAVFLSDGLKYLAEYPYGCAEQIASTLKSLAILKNGLSIQDLSKIFDVQRVKFGDKYYSLDEATQAGLNQLYQSQGYWPGGFAYYKGGEPNFYLTLHIVGALIEIKNAGYEVDAAVLERAINFLSDGLTSTDAARKITDKDTVIMTIGVLTNYDRFKQDSNLLNRLSEIIKDKKYINEEISNNSLSELAILLTRTGENFKKPKEEIFKILRNRILLDSRGAYLGVNPQRQIYEYYESPVKNTALLLKALVKNKEDNPLLDKILRWLMSNRAKDGAWGTTNNTAAVIEAFTDFLNWKKEMESDFDLQISLAEKGIGEHSFDKNTVLKTFEDFLPIQKLDFNKISPIIFLKSNHNKAVNNFYYDLSLKYFLPIENLASRDEGFTVSREFFDRFDQEQKNPLTSAKVGDILQGHLIITSPKNRYFVAIEDFIPAGLEIVNLRLATEDQSLSQDKNEQSSKTEIFYPDAEESHDDRLFLFKERLSPGIYDYTYFVRALIPGQYHHLPAIVSEMYFPENFGRTAGGEFRIER